MLGAEITGTMKNVCIFDNSRANLMKIYGSLLLI